MDPVRKAARPVTDPVEETGRPVANTVKEAVKPVAGEVDEATKPATGTVEEITDPVWTVVDPQPSIREPAGEGRTVREPRVPAPRRHARVAGAAGARERAASDEGRPERPAATAAATRPRQFDRAGVAAPSPRPLRVNPSVDVTALDRIGRAAVGASRAFRFPLLLAAAVLLFLGIQARMDARDPKLAAPPTDEELTFA